MSTRKSHRAELSELAAGLAQPAADQRDRAAASGRQSHSGGVHEAERLIRELQVTLSEAASEAEEAVVAHPFAAVASAFLLGLALGRMMGRR